mmetsp:Transcript_15380/g.27478  ORF Transcript_15380/g.27478 Transcript_15380/m.27478 type:complete len:85 (-) Transcript_15380:3722-3976(-)
MQLNPFLYLNSWRKIQLVLWIILVLVKPYIVNLCIRWEYIIHMLVNTKPYIVVEDKKHWIDQTRFGKTLAPLTINIILNLSWLP